MQIEIGFGNSWWITSHTEHPKYTLRSRGWKPIGQFHSAIIVIQVSSHVLVLDFRHGFSFPQSILRRSRILIGFIFS